LGATLVGGAAVLLTGCASGAEKPEKADKAEMTPGKAEPGAP
jgi:hypothetical protein